MFTEKDYDRIEERWVTHDAIFKGEESLTAVWFNPDSTVPSWEWATVYPETVLRIRDEYGSITAENARDFCLDVAAESQQYWDDYDPDDDRDWCWEWNTADFIGAWDLAEAEYLINWASAFEKSRL